MPKKLDAEEVENGIYIIAWVRTNKAKDLCIVKYIQNET